MEIEAIVNERCKGREGVPKHQEQIDVLVRIFWCLLQPDGCPWDRKQTHQSLARHMIEEAFEAADAMESSDTENLKEELGDVLLQVALHSAIAERDGEFTMEDVVASLNEKMVRRHPHIFGDMHASNTQDVLNIWQSVKKDEKALKDENLFSGIPTALPALQQAQMLQERAHKLQIPTFDKGTLDSISNEMEELENNALTHDEAKKHIGDILFSLVSVARVYNVDAESALREACRSYRTDSQSFIDIQEG